ncbi:hypothetical protein L0F51_17520 [Afifella sp. H1R]|uniref:hypothetical protein n=1 Tax=Afifella sp. H1R TaxID=2908841 RepID=UPI001F3FBE98|nr:hypothetical protein [Afifella sp. H1R]MCF1505554.1 hypothetical protein [Afifella sp. H1R]
MSEPAESVKRIKVELLEPGDIVLTADEGKTSTLVRLASKGAVSHAMICVQSGSIIDSTDFGVQAHNIQRERYAADDRVQVFRLREPLSAFRLGAVLDFARSEVGARYSKIEATRSVLAGPRPRNRQLFCSRLVARAYAHAGIQLVADADYCTPDELRRSTLLIELEDMTEPVSEEEIAAWAARPNPIAEMQESQNAILAAARRLDSTVENFTDLDRLVQTHPEWDDEIAKAFRDSGYLNLWKTDFRVNPWHYALAEMEALTTASTIDDLRDYCIGTIREFHSGGLRYAVNLVHYREALRAYSRRTTEQLVKLYERLVHNDRLRRDTALAWLRHHFPDNAKNSLERIVPHSEQWFSIVDRVEPALGQIARLSIDHMKLLEVCSVCGDPSEDYLLVNAAEMMPGVPSLRLCSDCVGIRRAGGEILKPLWD